MLLQCVLNFYEYALFFKIPCQDGSSRVRQVLLRGQELARFTIGQMRVRPSLKRTIPTITTTTTNTTPFPLKIIGDCMGNISNEI